MRRVMAPHAVLDRPPPPPQSCPPPLLAKIAALLGDFDFLHVRRGDKLVHRDRNRRLIFPKLDRDTRPKYILARLKKWVPRGRTIYLATNEFAPGFFTSLDAV